MKNKFTALMVALMSSLVLMLPVSHALTTVSYLSTTGTNLGGGSSLNPESVVNKQITVESSSGIPVTRTVMVDIAAVKNPLERISVYLCGSADPIGCVDNPIAFDEFTGVVDQGYDWEIFGYAAGTPYPQTGFVMTFVQTRDDVGNEIWVGFWDRITRTSSSGFSVEGVSLGGLTLTIDSSLLSVVDHFIDDQQGVPFNPAWVTQAEFSGASSLHTLQSSDLAAPLFSTELVSGQILSSPLAEDFYFVFPETASGFTHPITLQNNPSYVCGNGIEEPEKGESESNCCYDFGCSGVGKYCDTGRGACVAESGIGLDVVSPSEIGVVDCSVENMVDVLIELLNPPGGLSILSTTYELAGDSFTTSCTGGAGTGYVYTCPLGIPSQEGNPACESGSLRIGPNALTFSIQYDDGPATRQKTLETNLPDVVIASYTVGDGICERDLGEDRLPNSCYDCGCSTGQYCDFSIPRSGTCRPTLTSGSLRITAEPPTHFVDHSPAGDTVDLTLEIINEPETLSVGIETCSLACENDLGACDATCSLSCTETTGDPGVYTASCSLTFTIAGYDSMRDYSLTPTIDVPVSYMDGSVGSIDATLSSVGFALISVGSSFCGDGVIGPGEDETTCCFDAGCSSGYCDTQHSGMATPGDECKDDTAITLDMELLGGQSLLFTDAEQEHEFFLNVQVTNKPSGLVLTADCSFGDTDCGFDWFDISCEEMGSTDDVYNGTCTVTTPPITYSTSPFFDPTTNEVVIEPNTITFDLTFNDAAGTAEKSVLKSVSKVTLIPLASCGNGVVEFELGETVENCCVDATCDVFGENYFCYTGDTPNGECTEATEIGVVIEEISPETIDCRIDRLDKKCQTSGSIDVTLRVLTPPDDLVVESSSYYTFEENDTTFDFCSQPDSDGLVTCSFVLEPEGTTTPKTETKPIIVNLVGSYTLGSGEITEVFSASTNIELNAFKSAALTSTEDDIRKLDAKIAKLKQTRNVILAVLAAGAAFCTAECVWDITKIGCKTCWVIWSCGAAVTLPVAGYFINQAEGMKGKRLELEAAIGSGDYSSFNTGMDSIYYTTAGLVAELICTLGLKGFGAGAGATNTPKTGGGCPKCV